MTTALHWFRRDLRLHDNMTLFHALRHSERVVPVFVLDDRLLSSDRMGAARIGFLCGALTSLDTALRAAGSRLIIRRGEDTPAEVMRLAREVGAEVIYHHHDVSPYARRRDGRLADLAAAAGLRIERYWDTLLTAPIHLLRPEDAHTPLVYTAFKKRWLAAPPASHPPYGIQPLLHRLALPSPTTPVSLALPNPWDVGQRDVPPAVIALATEGELAAQARLGAFMAMSVQHYSGQRDIPASGGTSGLSPFLKWGILSIRDCYRAVSAQEPSDGTLAWLNELIWRDFYAAILYFFPHAATRSFKPAYDSIAWPNDADLFARWCSGNTGTPIVDAGMRQLLATGWMHNRLRMIVASYLTKDLLVDWRWGERHFMRHLMDGDVAANNGGWQWAAGTGTDAQPYFRIFNPRLQQEKFDPHGDFVRRWIPELGTAEYPAPIVDHATQRLRALALYTQAVKKGNDDL